MVEDRQQERENKSLHPKQFQQMHGSAAVNTSQEMTEEGKNVQNIFFSPRKNGLMWSHLLSRWSIPLQTHKCYSLILGGVIQMANSTW
jgi:hypothetical protein